MLRELATQVRVFIATKPVDLRKGIDGLAAVVKQEFGLDPFEAGAFVFCGRRRDRIKVLVWTAEGFELGYKRLENGSFQWPGDDQDALEVTPEQYERLMDGLAVTEKRKVHPAGRISMF